MYDKLIKNDFLYMIKLTGLNERITLMVIDHSNFIEYCFFIIIILSINLVARKQAMLDRNI